jgi:hypothetical protein
LLQVELVVRVGLAEMVVIVALLQVAQVALLVRRAYNVSVALHMLVD